MRVPVLRELRVCCQKQHDHSIHARTRARASLCQGSKGAERSLNSRKMAFYQD